MKKPKTINAVTADPLYYRFGLSGLTSGGKTCILAALAMPRVAHLNGYTATRCQPQKGSSQHLVEGNKWVDQACEALVEGKLPPSNPHTERLTVRYKFTDGQSREVFVELVDYSGELLDSTMSQSELAEQLHRYLAEVDGFLFVAECPRKQELPSELAGYFQNLREALAILRAKNNNSERAPSVPIALLVNKWDRSGTLSQGEDAHENESLKLKAFLEAVPLPPHAGLLADLRAASRGACRAFPVSAFGEAVGVGGGKEGAFIERPAQVKPELPSFGIIEPFLWLIDQCDRLGVESLENESRRWTLWLNPSTALKCRSHVKRMAARMSTASPEFSRIRRVRQRLGVRFISHASLFILACIVGESASDAIYLRRSRTAMVNPADKNGWAVAESWFTRYTEDGPWRHVLHRRFILSNEAASAELLSARIKRDQRAWKSVEICKDDPTRSILATEYLSGFSQGAHRSDALQILAEWETVKARGQLNARLMELSSRLQSIGEEVKQAEKSNPPDFKQASNKLDRLAQDARKVSGLDVADETLLKQWQNIVADVGTMSANIAGRVAAGDSRQKFYNHAKRNEWEEAGKLLSELPDVEFSDLRAYFEHNAMPQIEAEASKLLQHDGSHWREALGYVGKFSSPEMRRLFSKESIDRRMHLESTINERGDQFLYGQCQILSSAESFVKYREIAPLGCMRDTVEKWIHYLDLCEHRNQYRITVSKIEWSAEANSADWGWDQENLMEITVGEVTKKTSFGSERKGTVVLQDKERFAVTVKNIIAREQQNITAKLWDVDSIGSNESFGGTTFSRTPEGLQGFRTSLDKGSKYGTNVVTFGVDVLDGGHWKEFMKPETPSWKPLD